MRSVMKAILVITNCIALKYIMLYFYIALLAPAVYMPVTEILYSTKYYIHWYTGDWIWHNNLLVICKNTHHHYSLSPYTSVQLLQLYIAYKPNTYADAFYLFNWRHSARVQHVASYPLTEGVIRNYIWLIIFIVPHSSYIYYNQPGYFE